MIRPEVIKKIEDERREKTQPVDNRIPAHRDQAVPDRSRNTPESQDNSRKEPPKRVEIQVA